MASLQLNTDRQVAGLKPADKVYEIGVGGSRGLGVRVFPTGLRQFEFRYVAANGTRRRLCLGAYPDLSLAKARSKVAGLRVAVVDGGDPVAEKTAACEPARTGETLDELAEAYWQAATVGLSPGQHLDPHAITGAFARTCARRKLVVGSSHDVRRSGATTLTGRYGGSRFVVGLVLGHSPNESAAVTSVFDRHTYVPEKRAALELWANHLIRPEAVVAASIVASGNSRTSVRVG